MGHHWEKAPGKLTWKCACGTTKKNRSTSTGTWHNRTYYRTDFYATPDMQARGTMTTFIKDAPCTRPAPRGLLTCLANPKCAGYCGAARGEACKAAR